MVTGEFLEKEYQKYVENFRTSHESFYRDPSTARIEPFMIADGLYYVGDKKVCVHLIDTGDGLILLDSGYAGTAHLLIDSIWRVGFDPSNVKWILHTHGHTDHFGASSEFQRMFGTKLAISKADADSLRENPNRAHIDNQIHPYEYIPCFDYEIEDGEEFKLGSTKIRCILTPGHTAGVLTFLFNVTYDGKEHLAGLFGGAGGNTLYLHYSYCLKDPLDMPQRMLSSIAKIYNEPVTVHLGNHPRNNSTLDKREQQLVSGGNPFIDGESWKKFLDSVKITVEDIIKYNESLGEVIQ